MKLIFILKKIWRGQSLTRILMNVGFRDYELVGKVVDVGGGRSPDYFDYFKKDKVLSIEAVDASIRKINFENEILPYGDKIVDTIVCANVLEHIYNYKYLVSEMARILKIDGRLIGFVPFLINYHPDPHDYFRYTKESLLRIFEEADFNNVKIQTIGSSAFFVNYNNIMLSLPKIIRIIYFPIVYIFDKVYLLLKADITERFPLGYIFIVRKNE